MITAALLQERGNGRLDPETAAVAAELGRRGVPVRFFLDKQLQRNRLDLRPDVLVAGHIPVVIAALRRLGVESPPPDDYPEPLRPWLHRRVWTSTVRQVVRRLQEGAPAPFFVKPAGKLKRFTGGVVQTWNDLPLLANASNATNVICAEVVEWRSEFRVFVIYGRIVGIRHYAGDPSVRPDETVIRAAVDCYQQSARAPAGYGIDFGVLGSGETALVEVNEGYGLGAYGLEDAPYTDLLIARWCELASRRR